MSSSDFAAGVLLAAGAGARYGMPKVLAEQGRWLRAAVTALRDGGCADIVVVLGAAVVPVPAPARAVVAEQWSQGLSASLRAGIAAIDADFAVISLVDTPDIGADAVRRVRAAAAQTGLARGVYEGRPGHPVVIARRFWPDLLAAVHGDTGAGPFLRSRADVIDVECGDLAGGLDVDVR